MPHEQAFVDSVLQAPVRVLGLTLRHFSIGHQIILQRRRNPLVLLSGQVFLSEYNPERQYAAIQNAALVCYRSWRENQKPEKWLRFWQWRIRHLDHTEAIQTFREYQIAGSMCPPGPSEHARDVLYGDDDKPGRSRGSPFVAMVLNFVMRLPEIEIRQFGDTAYDFPFGLACFLYLASLEEKGEARIENEQEALEEATYRAMKDETPEERRFK